MFAKYLPKASVSGKPIRKDWRDTDFRSVTDTSCLMETTYFVIQGLFTCYWYIGRRTLVWTLEHSVDSLYANKRFKQSNLVLREYNNLLLLNEHNNGNVRARTRRYALLSTLQGKPQTVLYKSITVWFFIFLLFLFVWRIGLQLDYRNCWITFRLYVN